MKKNGNQILKTGLSGEEVSLNGIVISGDTDQRLNTISIVLSTDHELDFAIEHNPKGDELFEHLRSPVKVKGFISMDKKGKRTIRITDYKVLQTIEGGKEK